MLGSGMAATAMTMLALTRSGDHIVASEQLYGATRTLLPLERDAVEARPVRRLRLEPARQRLGSRPTPPP